MEEKLSIDDSNEKKATLDSQYKEFMTIDDLTPYVDSVRDLIAQMIILDEKEGKKDKESHYASKISKLEEKLGPKAEIDPQVYAKSLRDSGKGYGYNIIEREEQDRANILYTSYDKHKSFGLWRADSTGDQYFDKLIEEASEDDISLLGWALLFKTPGGNLLRVHKSDSVPFFRLEYGSAYDNDTIAKTFLAPKSDPRKLANNVECTVIKRKLEARKTPFNSLLEQINQAITRGSSNHEILENMKLLAKGSDFINAGVYLEITIDNKIGENKKQQ